MYYSGCSHLLPYLLDLSLKSRSPLGETQWRSTQLGFIQNGVGLTKFGVHPDWSGLTQFGVHPDWSGLTKFGVHPDWSGLTQLGLMIQIAVG